MIVVVTIWETNELTGKEELLVSHGVDLDTFKTVVLPCQPVNKFPGLVFNHEMQEYVLED